MAWLQLVGEDAHAPKRRVDGHCVDDVAGDEEFEAEQNRATEPLAALAVCRVETH